MVKLAVSTLTITLLAGSALAVPAYFEGTDLQQRSPRFGFASKVFKGALHGGGNALGGLNNNQNQNQRRSYELEERSPLGLGLLFKGAKTVFKATEHLAGGSSSNNNQHRRSLEEDNQYQRRSFDSELEERSPLGLGLLFKGAKTVFKATEHLGGGSSNNNNQHRRSFEEDDVLVTREDLEDIFGREFVNDIEERSPFGLGFLVKGVEKVVGAGVHALGGSSNNKNHRRSLDIDEELFERGYYDDLD